MSKAKLRNPFLSILRCKFKTLETSSSFSSISHSASSIQFSPTSFSLSQLSSPLESSFSFLHSLQNPRFSSRIFSSHSDSDLKCWNCGSVPLTTTVFLVCESCRSIQPLDQSVNYFQIFGLEKEYGIGDVNLESMYKDWQKKLHPDLVHSKSDKEREHAAEQSARVIDAYRTLRNPLSRAIYILKLEGVDVNEEDTVSEPELLNEIMEIREAVEDASGSQALNQIQSQIFA